MELPSNGTLLQWALVPTNPCPDEPLLQWIFVPLELRFNENMAEKILVPELLCAKRQNLYGWKFLKIII